MVLADRSRMDSSAEPQRLDVGVQGIEEVPTDTFCLVFVEAVSIDKIPASCRDDSNGFHRISFSIFSLAISHSSNTSSPREMACSLLVSTSRCHAGGFICAEDRSRSCHSSSISSSFSSTDISFNGREIVIANCLNRTVDGCHHKQLVSQSPSAIQLYEPNGYVHSTPPSRSSPDSVADRHRCP